MIVNDSCIVVSDLLNVRCRKQSARMNALNRHLKLETGVECARVVERGKGSGSEGGVLGDLDSGLATDWWRWCRYLVWGNIMDDAFEFQFQFSSVASLRTHPATREKLLSLYIYGLLPIYDNVSALFTCI